MFGLGKPRTTFGKWMDRHNLLQNEIAEKANVGRTTISNMCSNKDYSPKISTFVKVKSALKNMGYSVDYYDFWM